MSLHVQCIEEYAILYIHSFRNLSPSDPGQNNGPYNNNIPIDPIFIWNSSMGIYNDAEGNYVAFRTELALSSASGKLGIPRYNPPGISFYPFD